MSIASSKQVVHSVLQTMLLCNVGVPAVFLDKAGVAATCLDQVAHSCPYSCQACQLGSSTCEVSALLVKCGTYSTGSSLTDKLASSSAAHCTACHY